MGESSCQKVLLLTGYRFKENLQVIYRNSKLLVKKIVLV